MSLLERIGQLRKLHGNISVNRLEREAGLTRGSVSKWDEHQPSYDRLKKVADYFHVSVDYLISDEKGLSAPNRKHNIISIARRDGSYIERQLTDEQAAALWEVIEKLPATNRR